MAKQQINAAQSFLFRQQANTTNSALTRPLIQSGIGYVVSGGGATYQNKDVTFPVAFKTGTIPTVVISPVGYRPTGSGYDPSAISDMTWAKFSAAALKPTATTFKAYITRFDGVGMFDDYYYSWIAIGEA